MLTSAVSMNGSSQLSSFLLLLSSLSINIGPAQSNSSAGSEARWSSIGATGQAGKAFTSSFLDATGGMRVSSSEVEGVMAGGRGFLNARVSSKEVQDVLAGEGAS